MQSIRVSRRTFLVATIAAAASSCGGSSTEDVAPATPAWNIVPAPQFAAGAASTFDLSGTLPAGLVRGGRFEVDASGARLPAGVTLSAAGILSSNGQLTASTSGVIFGYVEPGA